VLGPEHPDFLGTVSDVALLYQREGKYDQAEIYAMRALTGQRHALGSQTSQTMSSAADLALAYLSQRQFAKSGPLASESLEFYQKQQPDDWQRFRAESLLGASRRDKRIMLKRNRSCWKGMKEWWRAEIKSQSRIGIISTSPMTGLSNFTRLGESQRKLPR
jgi:hypothetical protein